ncbi:MAG: SLC13 family permease [Sphingomonadales bacterium]
MKCIDAGEASVNLGFTWYKRPDQSAMPRTMQTDWIVIAVFAAVYLGMALGRWPGLAVDRTGVAMIGAIVLLVSGAVDGETAVGSIDFPTLAILFTLMVLSGQYAASGLFDRIGAALGAGRRSPELMLAMVIAISGGLSALLTNDVVVWAMTPLLVAGLKRRGLDPLPYVIAIACAANAGSAATIIGNPQNLLIGESGNLHFWRFAAVCAAPALLAMGSVYLVVVRSRAFRRVAADPKLPLAGDTPAPIDAWALSKAIIATTAVLLIFTLTEERGTWSLAVAAVLLVSRRRTTRQRLGEVDWQLLLLFAGLFVVTGALGDSEMIRRWAAGLAASADLTATGALAAVTLAGSNTIGNVPLVMLLLSVIPGWSAGDLHALALFSTLCGNFLIVGSVANIIAVERARDQGVSVSFMDYARIGMPVTLLSLGVAWLWMAFVFPIIGI